MRWRVAAKAVLSRFRSFSIPTRGRLATLLPPLLPYPTHHLIHHTHTHTAHPTPPTSHHPMAVIVVVVRDGSCLAIVCPCPLLHGADVDFF